MNEHPIPQKTYPLRWCNNCESHHPHYYFPYGTQNGEYLCPGDSGPKVKQLFEKNETGVWEPLSVGFICNE